jgi:2-succinyl-5-enolpyruvyl-6-hydroxy-3-cyclohexene-1-carboxylate synthase
VKATIVLLNNDGGGIFTRLPIANFEPPFTDLFRTPHGLDFEPAIRMYGLDYARADDRPAFRSNFAAALQSDTATVIEVPTDVNQDQARRRALMDKIQQRINSRERN